MKCYNLILNELKRQEITLSDGSLPVNDVTTSTKLLFNGFGNTADYHRYLAEGYDSLKNEFQQLLTSTKSSLRKIDMLNWYGASTNMLKCKFYETNINNIRYIFHIGINRNLYDTKFKLEISDFLAVQLATIDGIQGFITQQIEFYKLMLQYGNDNDTAEMSDEIKKMSGLFWNRSKIDLLELITALVETKSIGISEGKLTRKFVIETFEQLFNIKIDNPNVKLSQAGYRKKRNSPFLFELCNSFDRYIEEKIK